MVDTAFSPIPPHLRVGVRHMPPPSPILAQATALVLDAVRTLQADEHVAYVQVFTTEGTNGALVIRAGTHTKVVLWYGKTWGEPIAAGVAARFAF